MDSQFECGACGARFSDATQLRSHEHACEAFLDLPFGEIAPTLRPPSPRRRPASRPAARRAVRAAGRGR